MVFCLSIYSTLSTCSIPASVLDAWVLLVNKMIEAPLLEAPKTKGREKKENDIISSNYNCYKEN